VRSFPEAARSLHVAAWLVGAACGLHSHAAHALDRVQSTYLMKCGGCHGVEGRSDNTFIPVLRDNVGIYLCSAEGRAYVARVPNVSMSLIRDDALLAQVLNFVIFRLGGASTPANAQPFTAAEIHTLRQKPLSPTDLEPVRAGVIQRALAACAAQH